MIYNIKLLSQLLLVVSCVVCSINVLGSQETIASSQITSPSNVLDFSALEQRKEQLTSRHEKSYSLWLSELYAERLRILGISKGIEETIEKSGDEERLKLVSQNSKIQVKISNITSDVDLLNSAHQRNTSDKQLEYVINSISARHFGNTNLRIPSTTDWNNEFSYLQKEEVSSDFQGDPLDDCQIIFNGVDPNSLQKKIQTSSENLISYTHPKLEAYYKEESFLTGDVSVVKIGKEKFVVLEIVIRSRDAIKNYGMIKAGSPMKLELINGESSYLVASVNSEGRPIPQTNQVSYQVLYYVDKREYKQLRSSEIDKVGIMWTSGYEKYEVYNLDVLQRQIDCIDNY